MLEKVIVFFIVVVKQIILWGVHVRLSVLLQSAFFDQLLFSFCAGAFLPFAGICLSIHDYPLCFGNCAMVA